MMARSVSLSPASAYPGVRWPAVPDGKAAVRLALQYQLDQSQWWSAEALRDHQFTQIAVLLRHAADTVPYYRQRFSEARVKLDKAATPDGFAAVPLLTRADLQGADQDLRSERIPKQHGRLYEVHTSGSTGAPIRSWTTDLTRLFWQTFTLRDHRWHRRDLSSKLAVIRYAPPGEAMPPRGERRPSWGRATDIVQRTGPSARLSIRATIREQTRWLQRENPDYLLTYPSNLEALAHHFAEHGVRLERLREARTLAETVTPEQRRLCAEVLGVPLVDIYSASEVGYIALQCPAHPHYHVQAENVLVEVLDDAGRACAPGEVGRVVVTCLNNFAAPLIRYELGDYAEVGAACPCGRGLPVLTRIMGRTRNMFTLPNGEKRWPISGFMPHRRTVPFRQAQVVQKTRENVEVRMVVDAPLTAEQEAKVVESIHVAMNYPFRVTFLYVDDLPRSESGKFEDYVSEVG